MKKFLMFVLFLLNINAVRAQLVKLEDEQVVTIHSASLNKDQKLFIRLPRNYDKVNIRYPVVYLFDAQDKTLYNYASAAIDRLMWTNDIPNVILVGIAQNDRSKELGIERNPEDSKKFLSFIKDELLLDIQKRYRTVDFQVFTGHSLGGQFVTNAMLTNPQTFKAVISISAALNYPATDTLFKEKTILLMKDFLKNNVKNKLYYYYSVGDTGFQDELFQTGVLKVDSLFKRFQPPNIDWKFNYLHGFNHGTTPLASIPDGLVFIFRKWHFSDSLAMNVLVYDKTDPIKAIEKQEQVIKDNYNAGIPIPIFIYWQFADFYFQKAQFSKAKILLQKNIALDPQSHDPYGRMAEIFEKENNLSEAKKYYELAKSKLLPEDKEEKVKYEVKINELLQKMNK